MTRALPFIVMPGLDPGMTMTKNAVAEKLSHEPPHRNQQCRRDHAAGDGIERQRAGDVGGQGAGAARLVDPGLLHQRAVIAPRTGKRDLYI
jgi:hypothetical protein